MVEVHDARDRQLSGLGELAQQVRKPHRIASTGQRDDNARAGSGEIVTPDRAPDGV